MNSQACDDYLFAELVSVAVEVKNVMLMEFEW